MHKIAPFTTAFVMMLAITACENPADNVAEAQVTDLAAQPATAADQPAETTLSATPDSTTPAATETLAIAPDQSTVNWVGSKVTGSHDGGFNAFNGTVTLVNESPAESSVDFEIDTRSIWSDNDRLTGHLKSDDFFAVDRFPSATFKSTAITPAEGPNQYNVTGELDLHGVTKQISFPATIQVTDTAVTTQAEFFIQRFDFDIVYKGRPDDLIRDEVVIKLDMTAPRA